MLKETTAKISGLHTGIMDEAQQRLNNLLKPPGSLGKLEDIARQLAGITGKLLPVVDKKTIIVMAGDNGIVEEGVSSYPKEISMLLADTMVAGLSGVAVLARHAGATLQVVDIGLDGDVTTPGIINKKIRRGTSNFARGSAMTYDEAQQAIITGIEITNRVIDDGATVIGTGEIGIGNTASSSAILYALTKEDPDIVVGRGAGLSDEALEHKKNVIQKAVELNNPDPDDPVDVLAKVGGFDIAGLTGVYLAAAAQRVPVVIDGFISGVAAVIASRIKPEAAHYMLASHSSREQGATLVTRLLGIDPMLHMNMRLGEGTGCALAFNLIDASMKMMREMGTFADIGM